MLIEILEFNFLFNYTNLIFKTLIVTFLIIEHILYVKINIINKYQNEFTLDKNQKNIKVKRKYLLKEEDKFYCLLNNSDLLPGDIIFLKEKDFVPCDCILIEGECIVSKSNLSGSLDINKKIPIINNNNKFNYKYSEIHILYHGMEIIKTYSKRNHGYISVLCINTGPNTFKANQYSNIL